MEKIAIYSHIVIADLEKTIDTFTGRANGIQADTIRERLTELYYNAEHYVYVNDLNNLTEDEEEEIAVMMKKAGWEEPAPVH